MQTIAPIVEPVDLKADQTNLRILTAEGMLDVGTILFSS
jgi:hypothetical protein